MGTDDQLLNCLKQENAWFAGHTHENGVVPVPCAETCDDSGVAWWKWSRSQGELESELMGIPSAFNPFTSRDFIGPGTRLECFHRYDSYDSYTEHCLALGTACLAGWPSLYIFVHSSSALWRRSLFYNIFFFYVVWHPTTKVGDLLLIFAKPWLWL